MHASLALVAAIMGASTAKLLSSGMGGVKLEAFGTSHPYHMRNGTYLIYVMQPHNIIVQLPIDYSCKMRLYTHQPLCHAPISRLTQGKLQLMWPIIYVCKPRPSFNIHYIK